MVTSWHDIGGLDGVVQEIQETVIIPFKRRSLFAKSTLLQPPKGILLKKIKYTISSQHIAVIIRPSRIYGKWEFIIFHKFVRGFMGMNNILAPSINRYKST